MDAHASWKLNPMDLPVGTRVGDWCIVGRLGWGGYGAVYLVRRTRGLRRQAALKLALRTGAVSRRLEREVELLSRVRHPNVVRFIDAGHWRVPGTGTHLPFLVMAYVPGPCLYAWLSLRDVRVHEALALFKESALALDAVHAAGAVHRDVKGENLLVHEDGRLVLVDLGVGDYEGAPTLTGTQLPPGTLAYRSPEALRFQRAHLGDFEARYAFRPADDLYALGVTWYRALTQTFPFEDERFEDSHQARLEGLSPRAPSALNACVPEEISALVLRLLSSRPEERPASAREVAEAVDASLRRGGADLRAHLFTRTGRGHAALENHGGQHAGPSTARAVLTPGGARCARVSMAEESRVGARPGHGPGGRARGRAWPPGGSTLCIESPHTGRFSHA